MSTKRDLADLRDELLVEIGKCATKDDLHNFATKDDLKDFAKKDDLKDFAKKDDLKIFATKDDLKDFAKKKDFNNLAAQVAINTVDIGDIKVELQGVHTKLDFIIEAMTDIVGEIKDNKIERASANLSFQRHESTLENHEMRIQHLENNQT